MSEKVVDWRPQKASRCQRKAAVEAVVSNQDIE